MTRENWISIVKGAGLAAAGAALTYIGSLSTDTNFGQASVIVSAAISVILNIVRKYMTDDDSIVEQKV